MLMNIHYSARNVYTFSFGCYSFFTPMRKNPCVAVSISYYERQNFLPRFDGEKAMKNRNYFTVSDYLFNNFVLAFAAFSIFRYRLFCPLGKLDPARSLVLWWVMAFGLLVLGCIASKSTFRNASSIFSNVLLPIEIYFLFVYAKYLSKGLLAAVTVAAIIALGYFLLVVFIPKNRKKKSERLSGFTYRKIRFALLRSKTIAVLLVFALLCPLLVRTSLGYGIRSSSVKVSSTASSSDESLSPKNNLDTIAMLKENTWKNLDISEKLNILEVIKSIELNYFGIENNLRLEAAKLNQDLLGYYDDEHSLVMINIDLLKNEPGEKVLSTLLHELRHAYQKYCISLFESVDEKYKNLLIFSEISEMKFENENYISGAGKEYEKYYSQEIEADARSYSATRGEFYHTIITEISA